MKSAVALATVALLALALLVGGPTSLAQHDPETMAPTDQEVPATPCVAPADAPPDQVLEGEPAVICTPVPADTPVPIDTPVAVDTPVPTDTPRPADTPQPAVAADTPTPIPPPATETPTPTSAAKDVPVGTLSRQLPFANPGDDNPCVFDLTLKSDTQSCDPLAFPAVFRINFSPFASDAPISVQVDGGKAQTVKSDTWDFLSVPGGDGPGTHKITASETFVGTPLSTRLSVPVQKANGPHILVYPRHIAPGAGGKIYVAGFPPNTLLPVAVYRERQDCNAFGQGNECYELSRDLGTVKTNAEGSAVREFSVPGNERPTAYLVAAPGLKINSQNVADSLRALGRPWFVVDQP